MNPNPFAWPFRAQFLAGAFACAALLAYALYEQFQMGMEPCPKCIFQRIAFMAMGVFFLAGAAHGPGRIGRRIYGVLVAVAAVVGAVLIIFLVLLVTDLLGLTNIFPFVKHPK